MGCYIRTKKFYNFNDFYDPNQKLMPVNTHSNSKIKLYYDKQINFHIVYKYYKQFNKIRFNRKVNNFETFSFYYLLKKIKAYLYLLGLPYIAIEHISSYLKSYSEWSINSKKKIIEGIYNSLHNKNFYLFEFDSSLQSEYEKLKYYPHYGYGYDYSYYDYSYYDYYSIYY